MRDFKELRHVRVPTLALVPLLACAQLAACGGSTHAVKTQSSADAKKSTATKSTAKKSADLRECLKKRGVTAPPNLELALSSGAQVALPKGVTRTQMEAAVKACAGASLAEIAKAQRSSQASHLSKFAACMRKHGIHLPAPRLRADNATLDYKAVKPAGSAYQKAVAKCHGTLKGLLKTSVLKTPHLQLHRLHLKLSKGLHLSGLAKRIHLKLHVKGIHIKGIHVPIPPIHPEGGSAENGEPPTTAEGNGSESTEP
jgi:hypothetical protein